MSLIHFKGKPFVQNLHLSVKYHELVPVQEKGSGENVSSLHDNLIIHGDNLKALKSLLPTYAGRIKCIIIDPPYNTGNENWVYNDNVSSPMMQEWLGKIVDTEDLTRHDKWLCMMTPRLKLLKELLSEDGVICINIDDNEVHRLRMLLDEIFGFDKHLASFVWRRRVGSSLASSWVSTDHEYILVYSKNPENVTILGDERDLEKYSIPDGTGRFYASMPLTVGMTKKMRPNQWYELINPRTGKGYWPTDGRVWGFYPPTMQKKIELGLIIWPDDYPDRKLTTPRLKTYPEDSKRERKPISTWINEKNNKNKENIEDIHFLESSKNEEGAKLLKELFGESDFSYSKPLSLYKNIIHQFTKENDIILDSFAGSGTTAHAVLTLNKEDGGNRKFILVECEDYADRITAERVRRVIKGVPSSKDKNLQEGLGGTFSYFELGKAIELESILDGSNLPSNLELARYIFFTATGIEFDERKIQGIGPQESGSYIGSTEKHDVFLVYKPNLEYLKSTALNVELAKEIENFCREKLQNSGKKRMVFAPTKYLDEEYLDKFRIDFCQLPFEIYRMAER